MVENTPGSGDAHRREGTDTIVGMRSLALTLAVAGASAVAAAVPAPAAQVARARPASIAVADASLAELRRALDEGRATSRAITEAYLARIARYEPALNALIALNPRALDEADRRDRERRQGRILGPLHGIPIALKDNIHTTDLPTTGGALAFADLRPPYEAAITTALRAAGAIILAKTTMTELANWVAPAMPAGYSALAGYSFNPYDARRDPRDPAAGAPILTPGGSSSGIGTAAGLWAANIGTETSGSILNPAAQTMLVGLKPTVGRISRYGIIPITADQDTAGPMTRTVEDAAILLGVLERTAPDARDPGTGACTPPAGHDYTRHLRAGALKGARIGVPRAFFYDPLAARPGRGSPGGLGPAPRQVMEGALAALAAAGATVVDPANLPSVIAADSGANVLDWPICVGYGDGRGRDEDCSTVLKYGMKRDFGRWLRSLGDRAPVRTLAELRAWNRANAARGAIAFGQAQLDISDEVDLATDRGRYEQDRRKDLRLAGADGIDAALAAHRLDALIFPGYLGSFVPARAGYPSIIVPFGPVPAVPPPRDADPRPAPFGVTFTGGRCSEARLIEIAYAFEQATKRRTPPVLE